MKKHQKEVISAGMNLETLHCKRAFSGQSEVVLALGESVGSASYGQLPSLISSVALLNCPVLPHTIPFQLRWTGSSGGGAANQT